MDAFAATMQSSDATMTAANRNRRRRRRRRQPRPSSASALSLSRRILTAAMATSPSAATAASTGAGPRSPLLRAEALFPFAARRFTKDVDVTKLSTRCDSLDYVTGPMDDADADGNGFLSKEEYVDFTDAISGGFLTAGGYDEGFTDMPLALQETYLVLSCLCELYPNQAWGGKGCCENPDAGRDDTGIRTSGTGEGERPTKQERQYLIYVCGTMSESLKFVGSELVAPPTGTPTSLVSAGRFACVAMQGGGCRCRAGGAEGTDLGGMPAGLRIPPGPGLRWLRLGALCPHES